MHRAGTVWTLNPKPPSCPKLEHLRKSLFYCHISKNKSDILLEYWGWGWGFMFCVRARRCESQEGILGRDGERGLAGGREWSWGHQIVFDGWFRFCFVPLLFGVPETKAVLFVREIHLPCAVRCHLRNTLSTAAAPSSLQLSLFSTPIHSLLCYILPRCTVNGYYLVIIFKIHCCAPFKMQEVPDSLYVHRLHINVLQSCPRQDFMWKQIHLISLNRKPQLQQNRSGPRS